MRPDASRTAVVSRLRKRYREPDDRSVLDLLHEKLVKPVDVRIVPATYDSYLDYLSFDELDPVVLVEYPRLGRAVILVDGEAPRDLLRLCLHKSSPMPPAF